jgi:hypothetical protein
MPKALKMSVTSGQKAISSKKKATKATKPAKGTKMSY